MPKAVIFDYGVGNLLSLKTALEKVGLEASIGTSAQDLAEADAIALPGVGAFSPAAAKLNSVKETLTQQGPRRYASARYMLGAAAFL